MAEGRIESMLRRSSRARPSSDALEIASDPNLTLTLLLSVLARHRRATQILYRLVRGLTDVQRLSAQAPSSPKTRSRRLVVPPSGSSSGRVRLPGVSFAQRPPQPEGVARAASSPPVSPLQIRCFGRFEVLRDGKPVQHWRRGKAKTLLKYLIIRRQPVSRDALIDLLWPEADPQLAINGLRVTVHALRQTLGRGVGGPSERDYVISEGGNYLLNPDAHLWVDADEFTMHFEAGRQLERQHHLQAAMGRYEQAEALYRDDYLLEDLYEEWTLVRREELKDQYLMMLTKLADYCIDRGDSVGCIVRCHKILQKDPCREDAYRRLMQCYARLGQRSQALHWYELCARTLRQELDVTPSDQTQHLYEQVASGRNV